jgi:hypothetical protein
MFYLHTIDFYEALQTMNAELLAIRIYDVSQNGHGS